MGIRQENNVCCSFGNRMRGTENLLQVRLWARYFSWRK